MKNSFIVFQILIVIILASMVSYINTYKVAKLGCQDDYKVAKLGCQDDCGGVKIPFPFGIGDGCYMSSDHLTYRIECDNRTEPAVPLLITNTTQRHVVLSIELEEHIIRISSGVAYECYRNGEPIPSTIVSSNYTLQDLEPFNLSVTRNRLVAVGCDTTARVGELGSSGNLYDATGCMAFCYSSNEPVRNGTCSGVGCCETGIINSADHQFSIYVGSLNNHSDVGNYSPCNYAFIGEVGSYDFSMANLTAKAEDCNKIRVPVVYNWLVTLYGSCSQAMEAEEGSLICGQNTQCVDGKEEGWGYHCQCLKGYNGNPYLRDGCQDVDECLDEKVNNCEKQDYCQNTAGGYICQCPEKLTGNGTKTSPCINSDPFSTTSSDIGSRVGFILLIAFHLFCVVYTRLQEKKERKERQNNFKINGGLLLQHETYANEGFVDRTKIFGRSELEKATDNFNNNRILGTGGQGTVYKGMLEDGTIVAVKKSKKVNGNQLAQFINEVVVLSHLNHKNIVKLYGCCLETEVPLLVYEFVPNGTLYQYIHDPTEDFDMTWKVRFQIALECAGAIAYLHSSCSSPVYHRDIKSTNILLDAKYRAKISDFGTSKTISIDQTHVTTRVQGTFGYLDPEFFRSSQFSEKSDVYSFGVVLLELLTSKKPILTDISTEAKGLASEFLRLMETSPNELHGMLDSQVLQNYSKEEIEALAKLITRCLSLNGKERPTMTEVATTLEMIKTHIAEEEISKANQEVGMEEKHDFNDSMWISDGDSSSI